MSSSESRVSRRTLLRGATAGAAASAAACLLSQPGSASAATTGAAATTGGNGGPNGQRPALITYPVPAGIATNTTFTIEVRTPGGDWQPVQAYDVTCEIIDEFTGGGAIHHTSVAYFDFDGTVDVSVTYTPGPIDTVAIRPLSYGIDYQVAGSVVTFTLEQPRGLAIDVNGDIFENLQLFANPVEWNQPDPDDPDVIYFGPGVHGTTDSAPLLVPSGTTVYLAGGAVFTAQVHFLNVENASIVGRGVITGAPGGGVLAEYSSNITVDGITFLDPDGYAVLAGQVDRMTVRNIRAFSSKGNGDGIDFFCCTNSVIDGVYMRTSYDCIAIYNHRWSYYGDTRNITVRNSSLWADVAHPVNIGTHGNSDSPEVLDTITIENIDILDHREPQMDYQGCIALNPGDSNLVSNVSISDIRVEDFRLGQLINMRVMYNTMYNTTPGRGIENVYIKNLTYNGTHANPSIFVGYDETRTISNVTFENLVINGLLIADTMQKASWYLTSDFVPMYQNEHVIGLTFLAPQS